MNALNIFNSCRTAYSFYHFSTWNEEVKKKKKGNKCFVVSKLDYFEQILWSVFTEYCIFFYKYSPTLAKSTDGVTIS